jgi:hypothetical protein
LSSRLGIPYVGVAHRLPLLQAQPGGVFSSRTAQDRRRKHIELDLEAFKRSAPQIRALEKAMIDYYGSSVFKLKKDKTN